MKKILNVAVMVIALIGFANCSSKNEKPGYNPYLKTEDEQTFEVEKSEMGGYDVSTSTAEAGSMDYTNEEFPKMIIKPISPAKEKAIAGSPVTQKRAAWNAALTALKASLPFPDDKIIFDWSKTEMQINNSTECRFMGDIEAKNAKGKYVSYFMNIGVNYISGDPSKPSSWKASVVLVE